MIKEKGFRHIAFKKSKRAKTLLLALGLLAFSQSFAIYTMKKHSINSGGATMSGGSYELKSSIGQVDASKTLTNGSFKLNGGFWHENNDLIFKNGFE